MSAQSNTEKVLRGLHVLLSKSEPYMKEPNKVIVDKQQMLDLLKELNMCIYQIMEEYELTAQSRDKAEREFHKQSDQIIWDASRKAEDIYAASVMYTDEALNHIQTIMEESTEQIREVQNAMIQDMEEKKQIVRANQLELKAQLQDLVDTEKYLSLIEERNKEIEREKRKNDRKFGQPKEKGQFEDVKTEIRINREYFRNAGIEPDEAPVEKEPELQKQEPEASAEAAAPAAEPEEKQEESIDLSGASWDVEGLEDTKQTEQEQSKRPRLHFFRHQAKEG